MKSITYMRKIVKKIFHPDVDDFAHASKRNPTLCLRSGKQAKSWHSNMKVSKEKKFLIWMCLMLLFCGAGSHMIVLSSSYGSARLVAEDTTTPTGKAGEDMQVRLTIANIGDADALDINVSPIMSQGTTSPFVTKNMGVETIDHLYGGDREDSESVSFTFTVKENAITGYYVVEFDVVYEEEDEEGNSDIQSVRLSTYVYIEGVSEEEATRESVIEVSLRNSPAPPVGLYGMAYTFDIVLTNFGEDDLQSVVVRPKMSEDSALYPFKIIQASYDQTLSSPMYGTVRQPDETARGQLIRYYMEVRDDVKTGYYPVVFEIQGKDDDGKEHTFEQTIYFEMIGEEEETETETTTEGKISEPRVIVTGYETNVETVQAGNVFTLTIHLKNTSDETSVQNMKVTLSASNDDGDIFLPLSGSSTMFVERIGIGETIDLVIDLTARNNLEARSYPLTVTSDYEDSKANAYKAVESISIPVTQELKISIGDVEVIPQSMEVGGQANIMFAINNLSKSQIYNVAVTFEGESISGGDTYKGNIESGASSNVDVMLTGIAPTMDDGMVYAVISYENELGKVFTEKKEFNLFVTEAYFPMPDEGGFPIEPEMPVAEEGLNNTQMMIGGGIILAVIVIAAAVMMIRKKRKAEEEADDDETL